MSASWCGCVARMLRKLLSGAVLAVASVWPMQSLHAAEPLTIAAAADLRYAMDALIEDFHRLQAGDRPVAIYGSSGKFSTQIENGAPFDLFFSADESYPMRLAQLGHAASTPRRYAQGRVVLWVPGKDLPPPLLTDLTQKRFDHIAMANPAHAPYGARARQALQRAGLWSAIESRIVYGENVGQAAQLTYSGAADAALIALALVYGDELSGSGQFVLIDQSLHDPLWQAYIVTRRAAADPRAAAFAEFVSGAQGRALLARFGFALPKLD